MSDLAIFLLAIVVVLVAINAVFIIVARRRTGKLDAAKRACTQTTMATVASTVIEYPAFANQSPCSYPIFEYEADGKLFRTKYAYGTFPKFKEFNAAKWFGSTKVTAQYSEGMRVEIAYDPADPGRICVPSDREPYKFSRNMVLTSVITSVIMLVLIVGMVVVLSMP